MSHLTFQIEEYRHLRRIGFGSTIVDMGLSRVALRTKEKYPPDRPGQISVAMAAWAPFRNGDFALRLLGLLILIGMAKVSFAQAPDTQGLTSPASSDYLRFIGPAGKIGSAITVALGIMKAIAEWTATGRKNKALERAARLAALLDATGRMSLSDESSTRILDVRATAEQEFIEAIERCYCPKRNPSKFRRLFLVYLPSTPWAYLAHFFFFSLCALVLFGLGNSVLDKTADYKDFLALLVIACLIVFVQRWAAFEWRKSRGIKLIPIHLKYGFCWYPANTFLGLFANALLVANLLGLLSLLAGASTTDWINSGWPPWQGLVIAFVRCPTVPIAYLWARAEYLYFSGEIRPLSLRDALLTSVTLKYPERIVGIVGIAFLSVWCVILFSDLRFIPRIASFPDGSVGTVGFAGAAWMVFLVFFYCGVVPWIAVYRGLANLFDYRRTTQTRRQLDRGSHREFGIGESEKAG